MGRASVVVPREVSPLRGCPSGTPHARRSQQGRLAMFDQSHRPFPNRREAGVELASKLRHYAGRRDVVVLALPRGGVPVAFEIAEALDAPLDIFLVRKLGMPGHPEYAMGAIASGGVRVLSEEVVRAYNIPQSAIDLVARKEQEELERREREYRRGAALTDLRARIVILVDDGLATRSEERRVGNECRSRRSGRPASCRPRPQGSATA